MTWLDLTVAFAAGVLVLVAAFYRLSRRVRVHDIERYPDGSVRVGRPKRLDGSEVR